MAFTREQAQEIATKEALKLNYDEAIFVKMDGEKYVFVCSFVRDDPNDIPDTGLPQFLLITQSSIEGYCGTSRY